MIQPESQDTEEIPQPGCQCPGAPITPQTGTRDSPGAGAQSVERLSYAYPLPVVVRQDDLYSEPGSFAQFDAEYDVVHQIEGRVRLRVPYLKEDPAFAGALTAFLSQQPGVESARATVACASLVVTYDPDLVTVDKIGGWLSEVRWADAIAIAPTSTQDTPSIAPMVCGGIALALSLMGAPALLTGAFAAVSALPIFKRAKESLLTEHLVSADALDSVAVSILSLRGDLGAVAFMASLVAGGEHIRALTARRSHAAVNQLMASLPRMAWYVRGNRKQRVPIDELVAGDTVVVYTGELIPVDGVVLRGHALVDQKMLTGESAPVLKKKSDTVCAATIVTEGKVYVRAEQIGRDTEAGHIIKTLENAPVYDTRIANYARRFADRLALPILLGGVGLYAVTGNVTRAAAFVICDFTTGIRVSAPTAVLASMTAAVRQGLLIKGGRSLEQLAQMDTLVLDKTGTLTEGVPQITAVQPANAEATADEVLALAAAAERRLSHPAAQAIVQAAEARGLYIPDRTESHYAIGLGVEADVDGRKVLVGRSGFLVRHGVGVPRSALRMADTAGRRGESTVFVGRDGLLLGWICYADVPRPEAREVLARLHARGVRNLIMVTGDNSQVARAVARQLGIDRVEASVFPERKAEIVCELQAGGHVVGVIGDGINDSPALAYADVSFSLKGGTDVARETADVVLHGDLNGLLAAIDLSREAMRLIRQNLAIAAVPNAAGLLLAAAGTIGPIGATLLSNGSTVAAAMNALRPLMKGQRP